MSLDSISIKLYLIPMYTFMLFLYVVTKQINRGSSKYGTIA